MSFLVLAVDTLCDGEILVGDQSLPLNIQANIQPNQPRISYSTQLAASFDHLPNDQGMSEVGFRLKTFLFSAWSCESVMLSCSMAEHTGLPPGGNLGATSYSWISDYRRC